MLLSICMCSPFPILVAFIRSARNGKGNELQIRKVTQMGQEVLSAVGTICALNDIHKIGHIRLFDNRRVQFDFAAIRTGSSIPKLKDEVDLEVVVGPDGLVATSLSVRPPISTETSISSDSMIQADLPFPDLVADSLIAPDDSNPSVIEEPVVQLSQKLYEQAAVARAEGRYAAARDLFNQAIDAGGSPEIYTAFAKMLIEGKGRDHVKARELLQKAIQLYPTRPAFFGMYGQMERRAGNLPAAEKIFRAGLSSHPTHTLLRMGLAQVLSQIATASGLKEAGVIFDSLEVTGKLNKGDQSYIRFRALAANPRAGRAYSFLDKVPGFHPGIPPSRRDLASGVSDLVVEIKDPELEASFGVGGAYLVRCFSNDPKRADILALSKHLRSLKSDSTMGLIDGRDLVINPTMAFVVIPKTITVRDYLMSVLSENNEAIMPIDEQLMQAGGEPIERIRNLLSQFLGLRDLYDSTLPVSGRRLFGRERLLVQIADQTQKGAFVGIFGLRKMGKTSLMFQLRDEKLKDEAVAYVDLQSSPGLAIGSFLPVLWEIERDLLNRLAPRFPRLNEALRLGKFSRYSDAVFGGVNPALIFSEDLRELLDAIANRELPGVSRVVIILDELERCLPLAGQQPMTGYIEFFGLLRGLAQTERYRGVLSSVVVAANAAISEKAYWEGRENPVFSLYRPLFVPPLPKAETAQMIQTLGKGMSVYWEAGAIEKIYEECAGHPFLTRMLCSQISQRHLHRPLQVTGRMVETEIPVFIQDKSDKFEQIVELLHAHFPEEEKLLEKLALGHSSPTMTDETVRHLLGYQLITRTPSGFKLSLNALTSWLRRRAGGGSV